MPHILIQMYPGRDEQTKKELAEFTLQALSGKMNLPEELFSVSIQEVTQADWKERVYDTIIDSGDTYIKPGNI